MNAFNKTLNKPSKADSAVMFDPHYALLPPRVCVDVLFVVEVPVFEKQWFVTLPL